MTDKEKIAQLALAALRSAPPSTSLPKPAAHVPSYPYQPPVQAAAPAAAVPVAALPTANAVAAAAAPVEVVPVVEPAAEAAAPAFKDEGDPQLRAEIEAREAVLAKKHTRQKWAVNLSVAAALLTTGIWVANSPTALANLKSLGPAMKQSLNDAKSLGSLTKQYDKQLEKVAVHSSQLDEATRALGVDPASVSKDEDPNMEAELKQMTGGEKTTAESAKELKQKFGIVSKVAGRDKAPESAAEQKPQ